MAYEFKLRRRVEFAETDMAGIMHFSNFFRFMEATEHAFFRSLGMSITMPGTSPQLGWPRVHAHCDYMHPVRFEDELEVHLLVRERKTRSITYAFRFRQLDPDRPDQALEVARGLLTVVCVAHQADGHMAPVVIPDWIARRIDVAPAELQG